MNDRIRLKIRLLRRALTDSCNDLYNNYYFYHPDYLDDMIRRVGVIVYSESFKNGKYKIRVIKENDK